MVLPTLTISAFGSSRSQIKKCGTISGFCAFTAAMTASRLAGGVPSGTSAAFTCERRTSSSSSWKISGKPVTHNNSMNTVQMMLDHLCTHPHRRSDLLAANLGSLVPAVSQGAENRACRSLAAISKTCQARRDVIFVGQVLCGDLRAPTLHIWTQIGEVKTDSRIEERVVWNDERILSVAPALADVTHACSEAKTSQRSVIPCVFRPQGSLVFRRGLKMLAQIVEPRQSGALRDSCIQLGVAANDFQFPGHVAAHFKFKTARTRRVGLQAGQKV